MAAKLQASNKNAPQQAVSTHQPTLFIAHKPRNTRMQGTDK